MINNETFKMTKEGLVIRLKIIPNSSKNDIIYEENNVKIKITAQPVENKANKALIEFLAKKLKIAKSNIKILKGELNKEKTLLIHGIDEEVFNKILI